MINIILLIIIFFIINKIYIFNNNSKKKLNNTIKQYEKILEKYKKYIKIELNKKENFINNQHMTCRINNKNNTLECKTNDNSVIVYNTNQQSTTSKNNNEPLFESKNNNEPLFETTNNNIHPINNILNNQGSDKQIYDVVYNRDAQVLNNKLYPPLGRTERPQFDILMKYINNPENQGIYNEYTRGMPDTYRVLGYLTSKTNNIGTMPFIDNTLILYGRAKYPNSDMGEFYVTTSSKVSDIKIPLTNYNCNIKKITDIPNIVIIQGDLLAGDYKFIELPKADFTYPYI